MYCRSCGASVVSNTVLCINCGSKPMSGNSFCNSCGNSTLPNAEICPTCGVRLNNLSKSWIATLLFAIFFGYLGIHRFYTGHILIGILQLCTAGGCGIWYIIDIILIVSDVFKDSKGNKLSKDRII